MIMNEITDNPVVANNVNNLNKKEMMNIIDFSKVLGEAAVAHTATVDQQVVTDLINAFKETPKEVVMKFKNDDGFIKMVVDVHKSEKLFRTYETIADPKLIECTLCAMSSDNTELLESYKAEEHPLEDARVDPRINLFKQFMNTALKCRLEADLVTKKGERYVCVTFTVAYRKQVKFCLKRTEEVETIINDAMQAV